MSKAFLFRGSSASWIAYPGGLYWPYRPNIFATGNSVTLDAAAEKGAYIGRLYLPARTGSKTLDTTGSSRIGFSTGAVTFGNAGTSIDIGIQGVGTTGPQAIPDGVFTVKSVVTTSANTSPSLASNIYVEATPTTGTATLSHGDLIAVVFDMTARVADSVILATGNLVGGSGTAYPLVNANAAAAWGATGINSTPNCVITFSDGTVGFLDGQHTMGLIANRTWTDSTNPDERGLIFQVPFDCKVDALATYMRIVDGTSDFIISLYSTAESGATVMNSGAATITVDASQLGAAAVDYMAPFVLPAEVILKRNTDYCVAIKASGAGNIRWNEFTLGAATHRAMYPGGTTIRSVTRNGGSGDFASSSTTLMHPLWVRISQIFA